MAGIKEIRTRIGSVTNTQKITSAMKMVSAAKLRKAQQAVQQMRPYAEKLQEILEVISSQLNEASDIDNTYAHVRPEENIVIVAIASNSGLCGGFNTNISKAVTALTKEYADKKVFVYAIGKKVRDGLKSRGITPHTIITDIYDNLSYENVSNISQDLMQQFTDKQIDKVILVYNSFKNTATQIVTQKQFLPIVQTPTSSEEDSHTSKDYIFEPTKEYIVEELIPRSLKIQFYSAFLDSYASEHGARMTAMHKATDNAGVLLRELKIQYNKARQASITNEILEIVSGANALKG